MWSAGFQVENVRTFFQQRFADTVEVECFGGSVKYAIGAQADMSLADLFATLEGVKADLHVANYAISQTSLEQIFISFARAGDHHILEAERRIQASRAAPDANKQH